MAIRPHFRRNVFPEGYRTLTPQDYIPYFKKICYTLSLAISTKGDDTIVEAAHQKIVERSNTMLVPAEEEAAVFYNPVF